MGGDGPSLLWLIGEDLSGKFIRKIYLEDGYKRHASVGILRKPCTNRNLFALWFIYIEPLNHLTCMKAIVYTRYGLPDVLDLKDVPMPPLREHEVLVKVHASSVNSWDWDLLRGRPRLFRLMFGLSKPKYPILGCDIAGRVEAVGSQVAHLRPGDEVFGDISGGGFGGFAEYICADANLLARKPTNMRFGEAAAFPQAAVLALQGLRMAAAQIRPGHRVLINGAGGGVGTFAIQLAKMAGAEVIGVDSRQKWGLMRKMGADRVIDYAEEDYLGNGQSYDFIFEVVAQRSVVAYFRALRPGGAFVMAGGSVSSLLQVGLLGPLFSLFSSKKLGILMHQPNREDLETLVKLWEEGKLIPAIDQHFSLSDTPAAIERLGAGKAQGKLVIAVQADHS